MKRGERGGGGSVDSFPTFVGPGAGLGMRRSRRRVCDVRRRSQMQAVQGLASWVFRWSMGTGCGEFRGWVWGQGSGAWCELRVGVQLRSVHASEDPCDELLCHETTDASGTCAAAHCLGCAGNTKRRYTIVYQPCVSCPLTGCSPSSDANRHRRPSKRRASTCL